MKRFEDKLNTALEDIKNGSTIEAVLSKYPSEDRIKLKSLLQMAIDFNSLPHLSAPEPTKRRLYINHAHAHRGGFLGALNIFKNVYATSLMVLLFGVGSTAYATFMSLPGDNFFALKKGVESVQLKLTKDPVSKAALQLSIATKRLEEAQQIIYTTEDTDAKHKAIEELNKQTAVALQNIEEIAANPEVANNPELAKKMQKAESLAKDQNTLIAAVNPEIADQTSETVQNKLTTIRQVIAISIEQSEAKIPSLAKIDKSGPIKSIKDNLITLEDGTVFEFDKSQIKITDSKGTVMGMKDIAIADVVKIEGNAKDNTNYATTITFVSKPKAADEKPSPTEDTKLDPKSPETTVKPKPSEPKPVVVPAPKDTTQLEENDSEVIDEKPQDTYGGFILEPVNTTPEQTSEAQ